MNGFELLAVVVFFLVGYWIVDFIWPKKKADAPPAGKAPAAGDPLAAEAPPWHEVLGVAPQATADQLRAAYEARSAEFSPGRIAEMTPGEQELALQRVRRINDAYALGVQSAVRDRR